MFRKLVNSYLSRYSTREFEKSKKAEALDSIIKANMSYALDEDSSSAMKYFEQACRAYDLITSSSKRIEDEFLIFMLMLTGKRG